jgi:chitin synthase
VPWHFCVFQLVTKNVGRSRRIKYVLDEHTAPKVVIIMPCYNEEPEILLRTVDSLGDCEYPPSCLHIFLSFDGEDENELYLQTIEKLGVPITLASFSRSIDIAYRGCRITVSRFPHGGKRSCQKQTFRLIDRLYQDYLRRHDDLFMLFIDSDCILDRHCIQNFMYEMELKPGSSRNMLAQTGIITSTTAKHKLITVLQDMEYVHGQLFERTVESRCGAVTCLPGALTMLRFSAFRKLAKFYFADKAEQCEDHFDYWEHHLGEDRFLTHLFMIVSVITPARAILQVTDLCIGCKRTLSNSDEHRSFLQNRGRFRPSNLFPSNADVGSLALSQTRFACLQTLASGNATLFSW